MEKKNFNINLDRNLEFKSDVKYNKEYYYRMIGESGWENFLKENGVLTSNNDRGKYDKIYFFKGKPLKRYTRKGSKFEYFAEVKELEAIDNSEYSYVLDGVSAKEKEIRIYKVDNETGKTEMVFDSFKKK